MSRSIDSIPKDVGIGRRSFRFLGGCFNAFVEQLPIVRLRDDEMQHHLGDRPSIRLRPKIELRDGERRDFIG